MRKMMLIALVGLTVWGGVAAYETVMALKARVPMHSARLL